MYYVMLFLKIKRIIIIKIILCQVNSLLLTIHSCRHLFFIFYVRNKEIRSYPTCKTSRMPLTVHCRYIIFCNGPVATSTLESKHLQIIVSAIRLTIFFMKTIFSKLFATLCTEEMLRMPCFLQSSDTFLERKKKNYYMNMILQTKV